MHDALFRAADIQVFERGWLSSNNVLFGAAGPHETCLVDSGYSSHSPQTIALVQRALGSRPLDRILNTHLHSDHCGGNAALQAVFDCSIDVPQGEADKVDRWDEEALTYRATGQHCTRFRRTGSVVDGADVRMGGFAWQVIAAPGHDPASIILHQPELEILISADALWENGFGVVFPELEGVQAFDDVNATLDRIERLSVRCVIPGHGAPFSDIVPALDRARARLRKFVADPARHSRHAAKVLIKFHLLDVQSASRQDLRDWLRSIKYLRLSHQAFAGPRPFDPWCDDLLEELGASGAIRMAPGRISNA